MNSGKDFNIGQGYTAEAIYYYLIYLFKSETLAGDRMGFLKHLPEVGFLLKILYTHFPTDEIIARLPLSRNNSLMLTLRENQQSSVDDRELV